MAANNVIKAAGLYTFYNSISSLPEGALLTADNVVVDRNNVIQSRRGFAEYGTHFTDPLDRAKQLFTYKQRILRHYSDILDFDSDGAGTFVAFDGSYTEVETGLRIKSVEANGNFYFTTNEGIKKISARTSADFTSSAGFITQAGGVKALDVTGEVNYTQEGFMSGISAGGSDETCAVAYRVVWGTTDRNGNLILGAPSSRTVIINTSPVNSGVVDLHFTIPDRIPSTDTVYFYQIYRTAVIAGADSDPGDEMNLVIEEYPTSAQLIARRVDVTDVTPEDFREGGTPLYTNPVSGDGILQANEIPPLSKDLALFKGSVFYANTQTLNRLNIALLSVSDLISGTSTITISDGTTSTTYTFIGVKEITDVTTVADVAGSLNNKYFYISAASDIRNYYVWYNVNAAGIDPAISGRLGIEVAIATGATANTVATATRAAINSNFPDFVASGGTNHVIITNANNGNTTNATDAGATGFGISITQQGDGEDAALQHVLLSAAATPSQQIDETARSLVSIINQQSGEIVNAYYLSGPNEVPGLFLLESRELGATPFFVTANSTLTGNEFNPALPTTGDDLSSDNEVKGNRLYFSKFQQPEAVPLVNFLDVGPQDEAIVRILPLRESLFVLKEQSIYRVTGENASFALDLFDSSTHISTPDSAVVLNNQIYMLTRQDVATISDTGVSIISRPIEDKIVEIINDNFDFLHTTFGVVYESDRSYLLFMVTEETDDVATQCYRYNTFTNSWTRQILSKTCGIVNSTNDKLYLGASDEPFIEQERKNNRRTDFADRDLDFSIPALSVSSDIITLSSVSEIDIGDAIVQTQLLTLYQYNQILKKLDSDPFVNDSDYFSTLEAVAGASLRNAVDNLAAKLDSDIGGGYVAALGGGPTFTNIRADFNIIVNKLNLDVNVFYINYRLSVGSYDVEDIIILVNRNANQLTTRFSDAFVEGPVKIYKSIACEVIWAPYTFGDPSVMKQIREGYIIFERNNFSMGELAFASDLSPDFEPINFTGTGKGDWGLFVWGEQNWGGNGSSIPFRTYIPRDKQRCRYISTRFMHNSAREKYSVFGIAYIARAAGQRAYRDSDGT